jgi:cysteine dioxygenase
MKILKGTLKETLYSWPDQDLISHGQLSPPVMKKETIMHENEVSYISSESDVGGVSIAPRFLTNARKTQSACTAS